MHKKLYPSLFHFLLTTDPDPDIQNMGISTATENNKPLTPLTSTDYGTFISQDNNKSKDCDKSAHNNNIDHHNNQVAGSCSSTNLEHQQTNSLICRQGNGIFCTSLILRNEISVARDILCK